MVRRTYSQRLKERKWNNKGSSLALVITIMSIVGILGVVLLSVSLMTFRMKNTYMNSQKNFYDAERVMDTIQLGLQQDVAEAAGTAYAYTLENYADVDEDVRKQKYIDTFETEILNRISVGSGAYARTYNLEHLKSLVPQEIKDSAKNKSSDISPLVSSSDGRCALNQDLNAGTLTIKNLRVIYVDSNDYMTQIQTDIVLTCPKIDFTQKTTSPLDLTSYVFVANDKTVANGGIIDINGNAYLGNEGTDFSTCKVNFTPAAANGSAKLVTAGQLYVRNNATVTVGSGYNTWAHEIYVDSAQRLQIAGNIYINDDLVIANQLGVSDVNVKLGGRLYAYGNPNAAGSADVFMLEESAKQDLENHPANYSSSLLINGRNVTLDMSGLDDLVIAGTAYVGAEQAAQPEGSNIANSNVQMGDSIALKAGQRAYLVPAEYIAAYCTRGGRNPMSEGEYNALLTEMCDRISRINLVTEIQNSDFLLSSENAEPSIPTELARYGVNGIKKEIYQVYTKTGPINMVYFFLTFENEADAVKFGESYYAKENNLSAMQQRVDTSHYNTKITYPSDMVTEFSKTEENSITDFNFYYHGGVLVPSEDTAKTTVVPGQCTQMSSVSEQLLRQQENKYQNTFAALRHCLVSDYSMLTSDMRSKEIYDNLVQPMLGSDINKSIALGAKKVFSTGTAGVASEAQMSAVVVNGNYTVSGSATDTDCYEDGLPIHLVIASGDVTVDGNFRGLIIAGGTVTFTPKAIHVSADSNLAQQALRIKDANGVKPADYLVNGSSYLVESAGNDANEYGQIQFSDYVTYSNWVKQ